MNKTNKNTRKVGNGEGSFYYSDTLNCYVYQYVSNGKKKRIKQKKNETTKDFRKRVRELKSSLDNGTYVEGLDSVLTGASGDYQLKYGGIIGQIDHHSKLIVEDVDGEAYGGKFLSDTIDIDFKNNAVQIKNGDSGWYEGTYEISQDIRLKKNSDEGPKASE